MRAASPATATIHRLAEGPRWDATRERLLWVDILDGVLFEGTLHEERITATAEHRFEGTVSAVTAAADGTLLVAAHHGLVVLHPDGTRTPGPRVIPAGEPRRLNDGGTDPAGRFLVGTLSLGGPSTREALVRWEADGSVTTLDADLSLSNGLAWSADGHRMYSVDTLRRTVHVRDYDPDSGAVGPRRTHLQLAEGCYPDGIATDAADHLWVAVWGTGTVCRYTPDGTLTDRIAVPAPHTSSVAFAGPDLRTLVITTATAELDDERLRAHPQSGRLFTVPVDVPGLPVAPWAPPAR
ncbi:SMP-30/gluconolactonase/LRE family protein [Kitasatospora sp. YST-16]|uniref:SMP-30/gluconolactonase/LRE family protein n=1 Tax=Kitasatospora sp. YST-16 TaxID=2998080 RepID=UPI0022848683|nr:SMP-30/gluconolactonase/LRE family protein [Kitasatospora sp. YST-16]WAL74654.1 SMP-30/gluconolactonase/LRE family protein [Kitasatospora sp. YST-16]WNW40712.1 SMP-30/gluconolactonase/LRE family protein [Streptomyces sp. Li-HN-5-13]